MARIETITSKVRPIKKLFVIDPANIEGLVFIVGLLSKEIGGITNLILTSDIDLADVNLRRFIRRHDPDVILNYSRLATSILQKAFLTPTFEEPPLDKVAGFASTPLMIWGNIPAMFRQSLAERERLIYSAVKVEDSTPDLFKAVHYGLIPPTFHDSLQQSAFRDFVFEPIEDKQALALIHDREHNLLYLSLGFSLGRGNGSSVYDDNDNEPAYFESKPTIVVGSYADLNSITYFWNTRATFLGNDTLWLPVESAPDLLTELQHYTHIVIPTQSLRDAHPDLISRLCQGRTIIDGSRYYFRLYFDHWSSFEHESTASIIQNGLLVAHPPEKLFSMYGMNMNVVLEVGGPREMWAPRSSLAGELFKSPDRFNPVGFTRLSERGLATRIRQFDFPRSEALQESLSLPSDLEVMMAVLRERDVVATTTNNGATIEQLRRMLGGYKNANLLVSPIALRLLDLMAPKRTERLAAELATSGIALDKPTRGELAEYLSTLPSLQQLKAMTLSKMEGSLGIRKEERGEFYNLIQRLYETRILLRGKSITCPHCHLALWYLFESLSRQVECYCCGSPVTIPVAPELGGNDAFRLNELLAQAVDRGHIAVLLTLRVLSEQRFLTTRLLPSLELRTPSANIEVDIVANLGRLLGLCEVKTHGAFDLGQCDKLLALADAIDADFVLFSTLNDRVDETVSSLETHLRRTAVGRPVLVLTHDALLAVDTPSVMDYRRSYVTNKDEPIFII